MSFGTYVLRAIGKARPVTIRRYGVGVFVEGVYQDPAPTLIVADAVQLPVRGEFRMPEHAGMRADESATFYCATLMQTSRAEGRQRADEIVDADGRLWLVERVDDYMAVGGYCEVRALLVVQATPSASVFIGASALSLTTEALLLANLGQVTAESNVVTFEVAAGATQFVYYAAPALFGDPVFEVNGFVGGFDLHATVSVSSTSYKVWRSARSNLGPLTVTVRDAG